MGKLFTSVSSLWVLFIPLLSVSKVGIVDMLEDCNDQGYDAIMLLKQLGELKEAGLITQEEFNSKKKILLKKIQY